MALDLFFRPFMVSGMFYAFTLKYTNTKEYTKINVNIDWSHSITILDECPYFMEPITYSPPILRYDYRFLDP